MDGYAAGPGNDMSRIAAHAGDERMMAYSEGIWRNETTAVMGRTNYEGFLGYWPPVAKDPASTPRNRDLAVRSNRQIAERLVVTLDTVKKHLTHIFGKLGAVSRTHAVARARELKLLP